MGSKLNVKRWLIATVVVFVVMAALEYIIHGVLLAPWYAETPQYWRTQSDMMGRIRWMYLGYAFFAALFTYVFTRGYEGKPGIGEGVRYGFWIGLLLCLPTMFINHTVFPYPNKIVIAWLAAGVVQAVILGIVLAMIYKGEKKAAK